MTPHHQKSNSSIPQNKPSTHAQRLEAAALRYAARGTPVFPCRPGGKKPAIPKCPIARDQGLTGGKLAEHARTCNLDGHGFHDATTDQSKIRAWWRRWPGANIGIPTGEQSGLLVIDVDHPAGLDALEAEHGELTATRTHSTGSGGMHYLYRYPGSSGSGEEIRNSAGKLAEHIDVRAEGGYVIVPPSRTERPYEVLDLLTLADPPQWLLDALRHPQSAAGQGSGRVRGISEAITPDLDGPAILEGGRDQALTQIAGYLHDGTRTLEDLTRDLMAINGARCSPALPDSQVSKIARSIHTRTPCKTVRRATAEVLRELEAMTIEAERREWDPVRNERRTSIGGHTDRDVYVALLRFATRHGEKIPAGVRVSVSIRDLALEAAVGSTRTIVKALDRLRTEHRLIRRDGAGSGPKAGALVLLTSNAKGNTHPPGEHLRGDTEASVSPSVPPLSAPRLRWSAPGCGGRLGKIRGRVIDVLEAADGPMTLDQLARVLRRRPYDLRTRTLPRLQEAGVVECSNGEYRLTADWRIALEDERDNSGEIVAAERQRRDHQQAREAFALAWKRGEVVSKEEMDRRRRDRTRIRPEERHPSGTPDELQRLEEPDPEIVTALTRAMRVWPDHRDDYPSWWASTLYVDDYLPTRPTVHQVEAALMEIRSEVAA